MNKRMLNGLIGKSIFLFPPALSWDDARQQFAWKRNDRWTVKSVTKEGTHLSNNSTDHNKIVGFDHFIEFRTSNTLILKSLIFLKGNRMTVTPLPRPPKIKGVCPYCAGAAWLQQLD